MKISIIIPTYNAQKTIKRAVDSALNQDFPKEDFEIIVINDGSTDKTLENIKNYKGKIKIISQKNKGALKAANRGFRIAKGKYVIKLDSDDYLKPTILKEMVMVLEKNPNIDFVYCDYYERTLCGNIKIVSTKNVFNTTASGIIFRKTKFAKEGFYNEKIKFAEYDLLLKTQKKWRGFHVNKPLFIYIRRKESISGDKKWFRVGKEELIKLYPQKNKEILKIREY